MTPRKVFEWAFSIASVLIMLTVVYAVMDDVVRARFPRVEALLGIRDGRLEALLFVFVAAAIATFAVYLFGTTRGRLDFSFISIKFSGPSGPVLLWTVVFLVVMAGINYSINTGLIGKAAP